MARDVKPGDWVSVGSIRAVICSVYDSPPTRIGVVYLDQRNRAIAEDAILVEGEWRFAVAGPSGTYADRSPRLSQFVALLRRGT
jgi:hypothetical protein